ncbi:hypothetical protein B0H11DRAFT_711724 [Mycena galericulata]|nr:hypothetical protein B0H11DRAFT_711724 [Mycena galericulata]
MLGVAKFQLPRQALLALIQVPRASQAPTLIRRPSSASSICPALGHLPKMSPPSSAKTPRLSLAQLDLLGGRGGRESRAKLVQCCLLPCVACMSARMRVVS